MQKCVTQFTGATVILEMYAICARTKRCRTSQRTFYHINFPYLGSDWWFTVCDNLRSTKLSWYMWKPPQMEKKQWTKSFKYSNFSFCIDFDRLSRKDWTYMYVCFTFIIQKLTLCLRCQRHLVQGCTCMGIMRGISRYLGHGCTCMDNTVHGIYYQDQTILISYQSMAPIHKRLNSVHGLSKINTK